MRPGLVLAAVSALSAGAGAGAVTVVNTMTGTHEAVTLAVGDTLQPRFSIRTDTILRVTGSRIAVVACGQSNIFLRTWKGTRQVSADTIDVTVPCASKIALMSVCFVPVESAQKYHLSSDTSWDPKKIPFPNTCDSL